MDMSWASPLGIAVILIGIGVFWMCFAAGVYMFTLSGRVGTEIDKSKREGQG
jgi:hypothetical protein